MGGSWLQNAKEGLLAAVPLPPRAILVLLGLACYLGACLVARRPLSWPWALLPGLVLSIGIESWEVWEHYGASGFGGTSVLGVIGRHLTDVVLMNSIPVVVFVVTLWWSHLPTESP